MTDPTPNGQTGERICPLATCFGCPDPGRCDALRRGDQPAPSQRDPELAAALNEQRRQSYNAETQRTRPAPGSGTPDADDGHTVNVGPVTVADPGSGTPDPTPNGQTWACVVPMSVRFRTCTEAKAHASCRTYNEEQRRPVPPAPSSDTPSDERLCGHCAASNDPSPAHRYIVGRVARQCPGRPAPSPVPEASGRPKWEPLTLREAAIEIILIREQDTAFSTVARIIAALPAPSSSPVPEAGGEGEIVQPTMHILRRADGEEMGEFAFWATDGPDGWDMAEDTDHDEDTVYEILACYPVARRKILWSTLCETCDGEGDGCPACAGSGECEPPDAEHMPIIARAASSPSPVGDRGLDVEKARPGTVPGSAADLNGHLASLIADDDVRVRVVLAVDAWLDRCDARAAADREEPTDA